MSKLRGFIKKVKDAQKLVFGIDIEYIELAKNTVSIANGMMNIAPKLFIKYYQGIHSYFSSWYEQIIESTGITYDWDYRKYLKDVIADIDKTMRIHFVDEECTDKEYEEIFLPHLEKVIKKIKNINF